MSTRHTCAACRHEDNAPELYAQAGPTGAGWYCRNHNACQRRRNDNRKVTTMGFDAFTEPAQTEGDSYRPRDHYGNSAICIVLGYKPDVITPNSPNGAPAVLVDVYDLNVKAAFRNVLMMTGAIVDGFKPHVGTRKPIVIKWDKRTAKSGRDYPAPVPATDAAINAAKAIYAAGDPFAPEVSTVASEAPF